MSTYRIRASKSMGATSYQTQYETSEALKKALEYRDDGYFDITLTHVESGAELSLDQFMRDNPNA